MAEAGEDRRGRFVPDTDKEVTVTPPPPAVVIGGIDADAAAEALKDGG